ncbi:MAG: transposase [Planctomycetota bacterium]
MKRGGRVYAQMIANCGGAELVPIIRRKVFPASVVFSDSWSGYDTLSVEGYQHEIVNHEQELLDPKTAINLRRELLELSREVFARFQCCAPKCLSLVPSRVCVAIQYRCSTQTHCFPQKFDSSSIPILRTAPNFNPGPVPVGTRLPSHPNWLSHRFLVPLAARALS